MFKFKEFTIQQENVAMKVSSDAVLFGAYVDADNPKTILDVGTGSGLLALMMAQKYDSSEITAVEIDKNSYIQAVKNFQNSKWTDRLNALNEDFLIYAENTSAKFDLIISNPPFFEGCLTSPYENKTKSRHTDMLPFEKFVSAVDKLLEFKGIFFVILPFIDSQKFVHLCSQKNLFCVQKTLVRHNLKKEPKRIFLKFSRCAEKIEFKEIIIKHNNEYSEQYKEITKKYYLFF